MPARNAAKAQSFGSSEGRGERKLEPEQVRADIHHLGMSHRAGPAIRMQNAAGEVAGHSRFRRALKRHPRPSRSWETVFPVTWLHCPGCTKPLSGMRNWGVMIVLQ